MSDNDNAQHDGNTDSEDQDDAQSSGKTDERSDGKGKDEFKPISSQDDLDRIVQARLNRDRKKIAKEVKDEIEANARSEEARKQGDFKKLYEELQGKYADLEGQLTSRDLKDKKLAIAKKNGVPDDLADLLQGESDEDLEEAAKKLAKHVATREAPDTDSGKNSSKSTKSKQSTDVLTNWEFGKRSF